MNGRPASAGPPRTGTVTRRRLGLVVLCCAAMPAVVNAAALSEADTRAIRQVVEAQLEAFAQDDAGRAFFYASAEIQAQFGNAASFMAMVRSGYPMVIRPAAVSFLLPQTEDGRPDAVQQLVRLRDPAGRRWVAAYLLQRQADAGWRISGCVVVPDNERSSV